MSNRKRLWPLDPGLNGWHVLLDLLINGPLSCYTGRHWRGHAGWRVDWRTILPFLKAKLITIDEIPRSDRRVMSLTPMGFHWARTRRNHVHSKAFREASVRSRAAGNTRRERRRAEKEGQVA